jgi:hypothetical protein
MRSPQWLQEVGGESQATAIPRSRPIRPLRRQLNSGALDNRGLGGRQVLVSAGSAVSALIVVCLSIRMW